MSVEEALAKAAEDSLDLVEIAPNGEPPVCRIMDFGKYRFEMAKKNQAAKKKQKVTHVKEVKFRPGTEEADYQVKMRNVRRFIGEGDKVKITLRFRGREMAHTRNWVQRCSSASGIHWKKKLSLSNGRKWKAAKW